MKKIIKLSATHASSRKPGYVSIHRTTVRTIIHKRRKHGTEENLPMSGCTTKIQEGIADSSQKSPEPLKHFKVAY